jgi:hypothetical protein
MLRLKPNSPCGPSLQKRGTLIQSKTSPSLGKSKIPTEAGRRGRVGRGDEFGRSERVFQQPATALPQKWVDKIRNTKHLILLQDNNRLLRKPSIATSHPLIVMSRPRRDHFSSWERYSKRVLGFNPQYASVFRAEARWVPPLYVPRPEGRGNSRQSGIFQQPSSASGAAS